MQLPSLRIVMVMLFFFFSWKGKAEIQTAGDSTIHVAFLGASKDPGPDREIKAAFAFLKSLKGTAAEYISFDDLRKQPKLLKSYKIAWYHRQDTSAFSPAENDRKAIAAIKDFLSSGGNLLLTLDAFHYLNTLGIETVHPTDSLKQSADEGYGRKLGFHAFLDHPIFNGMFGGSYVMMPVKDTTFRITGFFGNSVPEKGKVIGVDWDYIFLRENSKLVVEYSYGKGKVIAVGGYTCFSVANYNSNHLELFIRNIFSYFLSPGIENGINYWDYSPATVTACSEKIQDKDKPIAIPGSVEWEIPYDPLSLSKHFASDNFWDIAGERMLTMGIETGGIEEIWAHPFMAFRDYQVGIRFEYKDTIYWLNDERPEIRVLPYCFIRNYKFPRAYLEEMITDDPHDPAGAIHYEYRGVYPAELIVTFKSNLRLMWPYPEQVTGSICYSIDTDYHAVLVKNISGSMSAILGANRKPTEAESGRFSGFSYSKEQKGFEGVATTGFHAAALLRFSLDMDDRMDIVYAASNEGEKNTERYFDVALRNPGDILLHARQHTDSIISHSLMITVPDENFNTGYRWALLATDRFFVTTPGMGSSLVAGYATSRKGWDGGQQISGRPGYSWYFGRDGEWSGFALLDYGDYAKVKSELEFYIKYQDLSGKIFHEATTSGVVHYDAADATPLFIVLAGRYFRHTGDTAFLRLNWPAIKKAINFCFSTDSDHDHLVENTNVGHGWVEGGELYGSHATLYMQGCWASALEEAAPMAAFMKDPEAESYRKESGIVTNLINTQFWIPSKKYYSYGMNRDGSFRSEETVLPAVPLAFRLGDRDKAYPVLQQLASNAFTTNWGTRIIREDSPFFKPTGYHYGSVWPLFTGWTALAEYSYGNYIQGFSHLMNNLGIYKNWGLGFVEEVMNGAGYQPSGVCPHQCWSETMVLQPAIEGMLGLRVNYQENKIVLDPHFPADWDTVGIKNIRMGDETIEVNMLRDNEEYTFSFTPHINHPVLLEFMPSFPAGTTFGKVYRDGNDIPFTVFRDGGNISLLTDLTLNKTTTLRIEYDKGIEAIPVVHDPKPGSPAEGLRIISSRLVGDKYYIKTECKGASSDFIDVYLHGQEIEKVENGILTSQKDEICRIGVQFEPGTSKYVNKTVIIYLKPGPPGEMIIKKGKEKEQKYRKEKSSPCPKWY